MSAELVHRDDSEADDGQRKPGERHPLAPQTFGECLNEGWTEGCPWVGCKHHLAVDVGLGGSLHLYGEQKRITPDREFQIFDWLRDQQHHCSLAYVFFQPEGGKLHEIADAMGGVSRERVRQIEADGLAKLRERAPRDSFEK